VKAGQIEVSNPNPQQKVLQHKWELQSFSDSSCTKQQDNMDIRTGAASKQLQMHTEKFHKTGLTIAMTAETCPKAWGHHISEPYQ
jgi:hypothetical protein